jgi:TRAP-type C4-dicarboxylate transport system permease small subunit
MAVSTARPGALRTALNALYDGAGVLAALAMVALLVMVMLSILGRQLHFNLPGVDAYAGYMMAAAGFLALAQTFKRGEHIRVTLLVTSLHGAWRRGFEVWALFAATLLALLFAGYSVRLAWQSYVLHDISTASDATPLWIPQIPMAVGAVVLAIAFVDELVLEVLGRREVQQADEAMRNE